MSRPRTHATSETTIPSHGGTRRGAGRPPQHGEALVDAHVRLLPKEWQQLRDLGKGDATQGIRHLLAQAAQGPLPAAQPSPVAPPAPRPNLNSILNMPRPQNIPPQIKSAPRPQLPRPVLPASDASSDLYNAVRAVPKTYSTRDAHPKSAGSASPRPYAPAGATTKDHADPGAQGEHPWWSE